MTPNAAKKLPLHLQLAIDEICLAFEDQLLSGRAPEMQEHLTQVPPEAQRDLLFELLRLDLDYQVKSGSPADFTKYHELHRFGPEVQRVLNEWKLNKPKPACFEKESIRLER